MARFRTFFAAALYGSILGAIGCAGDDGVTLDQGPVTNPNEIDCTGAEDFVAGISHPTVGSGTVVAITQATPTPPDVGDNAWTISLTDGAGAPVEGASPQLVPYMPLHGHGLVPPSYGSTPKGAGTYEVAPFDLIMPGLWEFTVELGTAESPDAAVFQFCAEG